MENNFKLYEYVYMVMQKNNYTVKMTAESMGVGERMVNYFISGKKNISSEKIFKFLLATNSLVDINK